MLKKIIPLFMILVFTINLVNAKGYEISKTDSKVTWTGSKGIKALGSHYGNVAIKDAKVDFDEAARIKSAQITIDMQSMTSEDLSGALADQLLGHLQSKDFFDVEKYKTASFKSNEVKYLGENKYKILGDLTIKSKTKPLEFIGTYLEAKGKHSFVGEFKFDRTEYDIRYGSGQFFSNLGDKMIHDEIVIAFNLQTK